MLNVVNLYHKILWSIYVFRENCSIFYNLTINYIFFLCCRKGSVTDWDQESERSSNDKTCIPTYQKNIPKVGECPWRNCFPWLRRPVLSALSFHWSARFTYVHTSPLLDIIRWNVLIESFLWVFKRFHQSIFYRFQMQFCIFLNLSVKF